MRSGHEYSQNITNKRGLVVDRDPARKKVKVSFDDEDETVSMWIDVLAASSGSTKTFMMPDLNDEVWCALDPKGEDGCVLGSKYNEKDTPPRSSNDDVSFDSPNASVHLDKAAGNLTVRISGTFRVIASRIDFEKG